MLSPFAWRRAIRERSRRRRIERIKPRLSELAFPNFGELEQKRLRLQTCRDWGIITEDEYQKRTHALGASAAHAAEVMERWAEGKKPICVDGCPMRAMDAGPIDEMKAKYGEVKEASGFTYNDELKPSVIFKAKLQP